MTQQVPWHISADYMESCNCDFGCPCNFSGLPSGGRCEALVGYHIRQGNYGDVNLGGVDFIQTESWPRAIHEGNGTGGVYISDRASVEQRSAIVEIAYGRAGGDGPFAIFAATWRQVLEPQFVPIEMSVDGKRSRFSVPGVLEVHLTPHLDSVSGKEQEKFRYFYRMALYGKRRRR
ncbi:MAG TPA: DUF1326 domain-containing protein [Candidatus Binataceae bacterium]|nr:DUF1326 domain-containing protein [Candidatus Binataceae bacterium]